MKTAKDYLAEANAVVPRLATEDAIKHYGEAGALFIDVRDSAAIAKTGTIKGALRIPRGFMEFSADETSPYYNQALKRDAKIYLVCGAGGQAALTGKVLKEMGYEHVVNIGGFPDWEKAGGPKEA
jgi:rhodanese-related sulfurtransferase